MNTAEAISAKKATNKAGRPPGPKGSLIMGVMREFNRDTLGFIERCRDLRRRCSHKVSLRSRLLPLQPKRHRNAPDYEREELSQSTVTALAVFSSSRRKWSGYERRRILATPETFGATGISPAANQCLRRCDGPVCAARDRYVEKG